MNMSTVRIVIFALVTIACWEFVRFLGKVIFNGLKTGSIRHTNARATASREESPGSFWMLVVVFSGMCVMAGVLWTGMLFDIADLIAGQQPGRLFGSIGRTTLALIIGLPTAVIGLDLARDVLKGLWTGVMETPNEVSISRAEEPARYWRSVVVWAMVAMLVLLIGVGAVGNLFGWVE